MQINFSSFQPYILWVSIFFSLNFFGAVSQPLSHPLTIQPGASQVEEYLPVIRGKRIALVVNQTSTVGSQHLVDTLLRLGIEINKIFAPEHGFRGESDAGEQIATGIDLKTKIPIISLYGNVYKPTQENLSGIDLVIYDIQDVGVRFYTYISTLHYLMEACAENKVPLLVLDRPNPNGYYVDGPVLEPEFASFIGVDPIPIVYGMTPAEYANMLNGEHWLKDGVTCDLQFILCQGYTHDSLYSLPINPSPNLRSMTAIRLYPSLCFLEGTVVSVGRGTDKPFMLTGYPGFKHGSAGFTPMSIRGAKNPPYESQECMGYDLSGLNTGFFRENPRLMLHWITDFYTSYPEKEKFFTSYFDKLAGTDLLRKQIENGASEMEIRRSWEPGLEDYKSLRKKYLLYKDFE
ncbi:MAG: DUF1343 domain-containing protein [Chitinophagales bacterium]|nr:DUF1343 domain-containing protein [Chitinophagales bacterium]